MVLPVLKIKKDGFWIDENGTQVPYPRVTDLEKTKEKTAHSLAKEALGIHKRLLDFKEHIRTECDAIYAEAMKDAKKQGKGNFTFFNFDATIKVEVQINDNIDFDSLLIEKAQQILEEFIGEAINPSMEFAKGLVLSAFQKRDGRLDTKNVLGLKKHSVRIKDDRWHEAMALIDQSVRTPTSKTYFRVWIKNAGGEFESINLNFSNV